MSLDKKEVFSRLCKDGCCWLGGHGCECYSRQLKLCYSEMEKRILAEREPKPTKPVDKASANYSKTAAYALEQFWNYVED